MENLTLKDLQLGQALGLGASVLYFLVSGDLESYFLVLTLRLILILILFGPLYSIFERRDIFSLFAYTLGGFLIGIDLFFIVILGALLYEKVTKKSITS